MEKDNNLTYDEALKRAEEIVTRLEEAEALSMEEYKRLAGEAKALLQHCQSLLTKMHEDVTV